ncbi:MAG: amino acid racemase [Patescibacteria group bacterium]
MKHRKKIGIIGGVGPQATQYIYEHIIYYAQKKYGAKNNDDYPLLLIESVPIPDFISDTKQLGKALNMLYDTAGCLIRAGVDIIALGSNTVHICLPQLKKIVSVPFMSTIDMVVNKCRQESVKKAGVLASPVLIKNSLYKKGLEKAGIETILIQDSELMIVDRMIRHIIAGIKNHMDTNKYVEIINRMLANGAERIILGCTELPLAINYEALGTKIVNSDELLAEGIVDFYYQNFSV